MVTAPVTMLNESRAFNVSRRIIPKATEKEISAFFKKILKLNINAKNKGMKNKLICKAFASVKVCG